jgi:phage shock protein A
MWQRFRRAMRSFFGFFVSSIEDPELILEQNIRDMNDQIPKMNESIAMVKANQTLLEKENAQYELQLSELTSKVKAAIQASRDDIAGTYASQLQTTKTALERNEQQLTVAKSAYDKALQVKGAFMREKEKKTREATEAMREARRAKWQAKVADTMESFQVAVDTQGAKIEEEAEKMRAAELVKQFKLEMGVSEPSGGAGENFEKTIGKKSEVKVQ